MKKIAVLLILALILPTMVFAGDFDFSVGAIMETGMKVEDVIGIVPNLTNLPAYLSGVFDWQECKPGIELDGKISILNLNATAVLGHDGDGKITMDGLLSGMIAVDVFFLVRLKFGAALKYTWDTTNGIIFDSGKFNEPADLVYTGENALGVYDNYTFGQYTTTQTSLEHARLYARGGIDFMIGAFEVGIYASVPTTACIKGFNDFEGCAQNERLLWTAEAFLKTIGLNFKHQNICDEQQNYGFEQSTVGISFRYSFV